MFFSIKSDIIYGDVSYGQGGGLTVTMDDIARALGITKGTVSKALSGAEDVSEATRKLVLEKAVEMILSGEIKDAKTQVAVLKLKLLHDMGEI